jgi:hypothetical protein
MAIDKQLIPVAPVSGENLRSIASWNFGFKTCRGHRYLSLVSVVFCQMEVSATSRSLVQRSHTLPWCVILCDLQTSRIRRPWPALDCSAGEAE